MKKRVLIVDPDAQHRTLLSKALQDHGMKVIEAEQGADALAKATRSPPDLVITNLMMPVMEGFSLMFRCKTSEKLAAVPFIICSDYYEKPSDEEIAWGIGAEGYINKTAEPGLIIPLVDRILQQTAGRSFSIPSDADFEIGYKLLRKNEALIKKLKKQAANLTTANAELARNANRSKLLLDAIPVCIMMLDRHGFIVEVNSAGMQLFRSRKPEQLIGTRLLQFVAEDYQSDFKSLLTSALSRAEDMHECEMRNLQGEQRWESITVAPGFELNGSVDSILCMIRDITWRKSQEKNNSNSP